MTTSPTAVAQAARALTVARELYKRIAADLSMIVDHAVEVSGVEVERVTRRPAGAGSVHLSFRLSFERGEESAQGCLLVPFADALRLAGYLIMLPDDEIARRIESGALEEDLKSGMLELASFVANAADSALRSVGLRGLSVRPDGCQGVRADVRPRLDYVEGAELVVARATARVHEAEPCVLLLVLPAGVLAS